MSESPLCAFHLLSDSRIISFIENCTNMKAQKVLHNEDWSVSSFELLVFTALLCRKSICREEYSFRQPLE